jgi:hypothetical protein
MPPFLKWAFRPFVLIGVSVALVGVAALIWFQSEPGPGKPQPQPVRPGEQEIVFLYPATNNAAWERFLSAMEHAASHLRKAYPGLAVVHNTNGKTGTSEEAVAEIGLSWPGPAGRGSGANRLVFRWYKLTSEWSPREWIDALVARSPPPLAIIGGNNSYWGRELALQLRRAAEALPEAVRPLLLLTTATADKVRVEDHEAFSGTSVNGSSSDGSAEEEGKINLGSIYAGRTFRFCFTNRQMATAITRFIWNRPELRPDGDPAYLVQWTDDDYSQDLIDGYEERVLTRRAAETVLQYCTFAGGCTGLIAHPSLLAGWYTSGFLHDGSVPFRIDYSVGSFASPNPQEAKAVRALLEPPKRGSAKDAGEFPVPLEHGPHLPPPRAAGRPRQPLLIVTGQEQATRRFLRDLARSAPDRARRFVVATGDSVSFNTIYRDRLVTWPIQDLPFRTVFFAHRNPVDAEAGFVPIPVKEAERTSDDKLTPAVGSTSGTEDLLLFRDVVEAVALAFAEKGRSGKATDLAQGLQAVYLYDDRLTLQPRGKPLFSHDHPGQRNSATGEHVIYLRPRFQGSRVLPEAVIEVWAREPSDEMTNKWIRCREPLIVSYDEF